jgi:GxxExxY protein
MITRKVLPHSDVTEGIITGFHDVVHELGCGFSEKVTQTALAMVLRAKGLHVQENARLTVTFRGQTIGAFFADMVVNDVVLVEVKAIPAIDDRSVAQILNYLKAAGGGVGMLLNFGRRAEYKRYVVGDPARSLPNLELRKDKESTTSTGRGTDCRVEPWPEKHTDHRVEPC